MRIQEARDGALDWRKNDWVAFLGAAYFRAIGEFRQYGLSARGVALDVAVADRPEEFPDFTNFYINSKQEDDTLALRADGGPLDRRRLQIRDEAHQSRHHGHRGDAVHPRRRSRASASRRYLDVLVLRDEEGDRDRLAARGARFRRPVHVDGQRRAAVAAAQQSAAHHGLGLHRQ